MESKNFFSGLLQTRDLCWLEQLDRIACRIVEQNLLAAPPLHDFVPEARPRIPQGLDFASKVLNLEDQLLSETAYESAIKYMSRAGWRKTEPGELGPPERPRLLRRAVKALEAAGITLDKLAAEAHLPSGLVHDYVRPRVPGVSKSNSDCAKAARGVHTIASGCTVGLPRQRRGQASPLPGRGPGTCSADRPGFAPGFA